MYFVTLSAEPDDSQKAGVRLRFCVLHGTVPFVTKYDNQVLWVLSKLFRNVPILSSLEMSPF
jgi:hypothetical protein